MQFSYILKYIVLVENRYTANSKKVILRKSKIQSTKYNYKKVYHIRHMTFNFQFVIHCTRRYFLLSRISQRDMFTFEVHYKVF